jgi:hypothetical protein
MSIKLNGATSGSVELDVPAAIGSDVSGVLLPTAAGTLDRLERAGNILQVVQGSTSTEVGVTTGTYTDTGLSATITPTSSTNKILVIVSQQVQIYRINSGNGVGIRILRDATVIDYPNENSTGGLADYIAVVGGTTINYYSTYSRSVLDSPNTTSAVTYKTMGRPYLTTDTGVVNFQVAGAVQNGTSYIQLLEVAA